MRLPRLPRQWARAGQTRSRLITLVLVATLAIGGLAFVVAWQDYLDVSQAAEARAALAGSQATSDLRDGLFDAATAADSEAAHLAGPACQPPAARGQFVVISADGHPGCDTTAPLQWAAGSTSSWFDRVRHGAPYCLGLVSPGGRLVVAVPAAAGGVAAQLLPPDWLHSTLLAGRGDSRTAVWLLDERGRVAASTGNVADALPMPALMAALSAGRQPVAHAPSGSGRRYAYAVAPVGAGWRLLVAISAQPEHEQAVHVLLLRMAELGLLVVVGLAAAAFGTDLAFGAPLRRLSHGVRQWRAGEVFAPGDLTGAPDEVQQLAGSFADATVGLRQQEAKLREAEKQQGLLVLEVHHRVKNNLQIVASLLNLQASRIRTPDTQAEFQTARDRIRALATLHRHLYADGELHTINMQSFLAELCGQLFQTLGEVEGGRISLLIEAPELRISSDQAVPIALIVTEIVTNSVRFAFPNARSGRIVVRLTQSADALDLEVSDDGVGIAAAGLLERDRDGLGLRLIRGFSRQLGATLRVEHGGGTRYIIRMSHPSPGKPVRPFALDAMSPGESKLHEPIHSS